MNRRQFTASLAALAAAPALPAKALASVSAAIPNPARFWAIYMSHLHGTCPPAVLAKVTGVSPSIARGYLSRLVAEGVLTPTKVVARAVTAKVAQPMGKSKAASARLKKFLHKEILDKDAKTDCDSPSVNHNQAELGHDEPNHIAEAPPAKDPS
jgi:hypothetical protein